MEGPVEFLEGIAAGTRNLVGSVVGGAAGALLKVTQATSKGLAALTMDHSYQNARIQRREIQSQTTSGIVASGKNAVKDIVEGVKGVVKKPMKGAKRSGIKGLVKSLRKGFLGLVGRSASGVADLTSTSFKLIKRFATDEQIVHRIRNPRQVARGGLVRPSIAHETLGNFIFDEFSQEQRTEHEDYIAHIDSSIDPPSLFFATTKRVFFLVGDKTTPNQFQMEWSINYKDIKGSPTVKFYSNFIEVAVKETNTIALIKKDSLYVKVVSYQNIGEAP